jgi:hypothetical protein
MTVADVLQRVSLLADRLDAVIRRDDRLSVVISTDDARSAATEEESGAPTRAGFAFARVGVRVERSRQSLPCHADLGNFTQALSSVDASVALPAE